MGVPDDPRERVRSNADLSVGPSESPPREAAASEVSLGGRVGEDSNFAAVVLDETISIPSNVMRKKNIHVLQVSGDSMIADHVIDGDLVIVEKRNTARDGEMVIAFLRNRGAAVKRFYRDGHRIRLEPADPSCEAVFLDENDVAIQGVVVGILRKYRDRSSQDATGPSAISGLASART